MLRGTTLFRCPNCGHVFKALDIEDNATVYSMPMPCPRCGAKSSPVGISAAWLALHPLATNSFMFVASECGPAPLGDVLAPICHLRVEPYSLGRHFARFRPDCTH